MISLPTSTTIVNPHVGGEPRKFLQPLADKGDFLLVIDNTSLDYWKRCPQAARNFIVLRRQAGAKNAALTFGGTIHEGIEQHLKGASDEDIVLAMTKYWTENTPPADEYRTLPNAVTVVSEYRNRLTMPDFRQRILSDSHGLLIERPFELPLGVLEVNDWIPASLSGLTEEQLDAQETMWDNDHGTLVKLNHLHIAWSGRIDLVCECGPEMLPFVLDHKTTSITGDQFIQAFTMASQPTGYVWAGQQLWPDLSLSRFCLDALAIKKPGKNQGLTDRGARGGDPPLSFFRAYFSYSPERVAQWKSDTLAHISDFVASLCRAHFPFNDKQCFDKYGRCPYYDACTIDDRQIGDRFLLSDAYLTVTWNPTI